MKIPLFCHILCLQEKLSNFFWRLWWSICQLSSFYQVSFSSSGNRIILILGYIQNDSNNLTHNYFVCSFYDHDTLYKIPVHDLISIHFLLTQLFSFTGNSYLKTTFPNKQKSIFFKYEKFSCVCGSSRFFQRSNAMWYFSVIPYLFMKYLWVEMTFIYETITKI